MKIDYSQKVKVLLKLEDIIKMNKLGTKSFTQQQYNQTTTIIIVNFTRSSYMPTEKR